MEAVILAGGCGTRLGKLTEKLPKPLIRIGNKPVLFHQILLLRRYGVKKIWVLSGYFGEKIDEYLSKNNFGIEIHNFIEDTHLGTAGALKTLEGKIKGDFIVFSGDVMLDVNIRRFVRFHKKNTSSVGSIIVHPNDHPFDSDLVEVGSKWKVVNFLARINKTQPKDLLFKNLSNASVFLFRPKIFNYIPKGIVCDLEKDIFPKILAKEGRLFAYSTPEYIKDMGSPARLKKVRHDYLTGKINTLNIENKRKAIFLDRDGTINANVPKLTKTQDFRLFPFTAKAIKKINNSEYLAIVVTNQPAIAKGFMTYDDLETIHRKMETELGWQGAKIDGIYFCPHYPESGFKGEVRELKVKCSCRKPKIGLIKQAVVDFNIDLAKSFIIGDMTIDAKLAENAKVKFIGVKTGFGLKDKIFKVSDDLVVVNNLNFAVDQILKKSYS